MHIAYARAYKYKSIFFEWHNYCGPIFLRIKDEDEKPWRGIGLRQYGELNSWLALSEEQREDFRYY